MRFHHRTSVLIAVVATVSLLSTAIVHAFDGDFDPTPELLAVSDDTPNIRLEQDETHQLFEQYMWEIAANEANFFITDVTNGRTSPLLISSGAPDDTLRIQWNGNVGIGIPQISNGQPQSPKAKLHIDNGHGSNGNGIGLRVDNGDVSVTHGDINVVRGKINGQLSSMKSGIIHSNEFDNDNIASVVFHEPYPSVSTTITPHQYAVSLTLEVESDIDKVMAAYVIRESMDEYGFNIKLVGGNAGIDDDIVAVHWTTIFQQ